MAPEVHVDKHAASQGEHEDNPATFGFTIFYTVIGLVLLLLLLIL